MILSFVLKCLLFQPLLLPSRSPWPNMYPSIDESMMQFRAARYHLRSQTHLLPLSLLQSHIHPVSLCSPPATCRHMTCAPESRVYSITTLLHLAHDPEIKPISLMQREKIRKVIPEIVMSRKMRKSLEFSANPRATPNKGSCPTLRNAIKGCSCFYFYSIWNLSPTTAATARFQGQEAAKAKQCHGGSQLAYFQASVCRCVTIFSI